MLKPLDKEIVQEVKNNPLFAFSYVDEEDNEFIMFKKPSKIEYKRFKQAQQSGNDEAAQELMYSCILAPDPKQLKSLLENELIIEQVVTVSFITKVAEPVKNLKIK